MVELVVEAVSQETEVSIAGTAAQELEEAARWLHKCFCEYRYAEVFEWRASGPRVTVSGDDCEPGAALWEALEPFQPVTLRSIAGDMG